MEPTVWNNLIRSVHASGKRAVIAVTGGGSGAIGSLLRVPGGSQSVLEAVVPYSAAALVDFLRGAPDQFCSEATARSMAMASWMRARRLAPETHRHALVGIGATASLVSDKPKKGEHRIHVGVQTAEATWTLSLTLSKRLRTRQQEELLATMLLLTALGEACGVEGSGAEECLVAKLRGEEAVVRNAQIAEPAWTQLLLGEVKCVGGEAAPQVVFPGAFNPLHRGHARMARVAAEKCGGEVAYELSITNVDKPPLDFVEIGARLRGIREHDAARDVLLTAAPTFAEKAVLLPGTTFVVGVDTVMRIADPKYYGNDQRRRDEAIAEIAGAGCRFLVFGRQVGERFRCLGDMKLPAELRALCDEVAENEFHEDVSSTELRNQ